MGSVLLLGGTGAIGHYLVSELLGYDYKVCVTSRIKRNDSGGRVHYICGNAHDVKFVKQLVCQTSYNAIVDFMVYTTAEFKDRYTFLLNQTDHYLFLSSYRVFADTGDDLLTERSPRLLDVCKDKAFLATDEYALSKARQEDVLRAGARTNWTILRPCITYSRNRFQLGTLEADTVCFRAIQGVPVIMAREILSRHTTMTWGGDVARLIARLILKRDAMGEDFNVVTSEHHTWYEVAQYYKELIGLEIVETSVGHYAEIVGNKYQIMYDRMYNRIHNNKKVLQATGMDQCEFMLLKDGLQRELHEFIKSPSFKYVDLELNARLDYATHAQISLSAFSIRRRTEYWLAKYPVLRWLSGMRGWWD